MADNTLTLKFDETSAMKLADKVGKEIVLPIVNGAGKSAYAIAVAHGFQGTEQEWLNSLRGPQGPQGKPFTYDDFTQEQLEALKGPKGDKGEQGGSVDLSDYVQKSELSNYQTKQDANLANTITANRIKEYLAEKGINTDGDDLAGVIIDCLREIDRRAGSSSGNNSTIPDDNRGKPAVQRPELGEFVKDIQLISTTSDDELSGVGKVYTKGVQLIPTKFSTQNTRGLSAFQRNMISQATSNKYVEIVEVDYTKVSNTDKSKGVILDTLNLNNFYARDIIILKVSKSQVMTQGAGPFAPDTIGQSDTITFQSNGGPPSVPRNKVQINGSALIQIEDGKTYTYHFSTDQITSA